MAEWISIDTTYDLDLMLSLVHGMSISSLDQRGNDHTLPGTISWKPQRVAAVGTDLERSVFTSKAP